MTARIIGLGLCVLSISALSVVVPAALADLSSMSARHQVAQWRGGVVPVFGSGQWQTAEVSLRQALAYTPNDPNLHDHLAFLLAIKAFQEGSNPEDQRAWLDDARVHYQQAAFLRPMLGHSWAYLALVEHALANANTSNVNAIWLPLSNALTYGARDIRVLETVLDIVLQRWSTMPSKLQNAFLAAVVHLPDRQQQRLAQMADALGLQGFFQNLIKSN